MKASSAIDTGYVRFGSMFPLKHGYNSSTSHPSDASASIEGIHNSAPIIYTLNAALTKAPTALEERCQSSTNRLVLNTTKAFVHIYGAT